MSAFHPIATEQRTQFYVGFVPKADMQPDYSITSSARASSVGGTVEAQRLGGVEIDHQLVFGRCMTGRSDGFSPL